MAAEFEQAYFDKAYGRNYRKRNPTRKLRYYLREIRKLRPSGRLLDVGCAYGLFLAEAREHFAVAGSDISRTAVEAARQILPGVDLRCAGIESLTTSEPFDVVTCFDVLEHVADPDAALEVLKSMLRPQGILAVVVPVYDTLAGALVRLADRDPTHRWKEGRRFWREKLASHGFVLVADHGLWRFGGCGLPYLFWGGARWRGFSPAILLIGARP